MSRPRPLQLPARHFIAILSVSSLVAAACGKTGRVETRPASAGAAPVTGAAGSASGHPNGGTAPTPETPAENVGGEPTSSGGAPAEQGSGTLVIEVTGLPADVAAELLIAGPDQRKVTASGTLVGVAAGSYAVTAARVYAPDPIVRTVFQATVTPSDFDLVANGSQAISIAYSAMPSSNKLWNTSFQAVAAFEPGALAETSTRDAIVSHPKRVTRGLAFDRDGHLWSLGRDAPDPHIVRLPDTSLVASGQLAPDVSIDLADESCHPAFMDMAFDSTGNLWLSSSCRDDVIRLSAGDLGASGEKRPDARLTAADPESVVLDRNGNLWVANYTGLLRFDAARLGAIDSDPPDLQLSLVARTGLRELRSSGMAFDAAGNLWGIDFYSERLFRLAQGDLAGTGMRTVEAAVAFKVVPSPGAISSAPAFDESGGLWLSLSGAGPSGTLGRFSREQLAMSSASFLEPERQITSPAVGTGQASFLAFFPAPRGLPLFHSLPAP